MNQAQHVRTGDVYPPTAAKREARHERDKIIEQGQHQQEQQGGGDLHVDETDLPAGRRMVTASASGQVMAQFTVPVPERAVAGATDAVTIAEAIQAAAQTTAGDEPVGLADAAAAQAAEMLATGLRGNIPGGVAAAAQRAAETNAKRAAEDGGGDRVTLRDVVMSGAGDAMPANKVATREDAQVVAAAAARIVGKGAGGGGGGGGGGIAGAVVAAADMNEGRMM